MNWSLSLFLWYAVLASLLWQVRKGRPPTVGLALSYWLNLASHHLVSETLCLLYENPSEYRSAAAVGFGLSGYAMIGLLLGIWMSSWLFHVRRIAAIQTQYTLPATSASPQLAVLVGMVVFVFGSVVSTVWLPGMSAVVFTGNMLVSAGFAWWWWCELSAKRMIRATLTIIISTIVPLITLVLLGFIGFGIFTLMAVASFVLCRVRKRLAHLYLGIPLVYLVLSIGITYMIGKEEIRASVWGGDSVSDRVFVITDKFATEFKFFDPFDDRQRQLIDLRFNQNYFVGMAAERIQRGQITYWYGQSFADGFWALVPRAIWSDKPTISGGTELMRFLTGLTFVDGVSFGIGHILEMYANFGPFGMIIGFGMFGMALGLFDHKAGKALAAGSFEKFILWYLPWTALLTG